MYEIQVVEEPEAIHEGHNARVAGMGKMLLV